MKHRIATIAGLISVIWGVTGCGGTADDPNTSKLAAAPAAPTTKTLGTVVQSSAAIVKVCAGPNSAPTCKSGPLPKAAGNVRNMVRGNFVSPVTASASWLALTKTHASICYMGTRSTTVSCLPVKANVPKDVDVSFIDAGSGRKALVFTTKAGATATKAEIQRSVRTFVNALEPVSKAVQTHAKKTYTARLHALGGHPSYVSPMLIDAGGGSCSYSGDWGSCDGGGGGYDGGGSWDTWDASADQWDYDTTSWETSAAESAADTWGYPGSDWEPAAEDPYASEFPDFSSIWEEPPVVAPDIPPSPSPFPEGEISQAGWPGCTASGPIIICTSPRPEPVPIDPYDIVPVPPPTPWFPAIPTWSLCSAFGVFCSDNDRGDGAVHGGRTVEQLKQACWGTYETEVDVCNANGAMGDWRMQQACLDKAFSRYSSCLRTADSAGSDSNR